LEAGERLKKRVMNEGRCYICTLPIPCNHFGTVEEEQTSKAAKKLAKRQSLLLSPKSHMN